MSPPLVVVSYNVHGWIGADRRYAPERCLAVLGEIGPDIAGLQEVTLFGESPEAPERPAEDPLRYTESLIASRSGMTVVAGPTLERHEASYGNLLLTRHPIAAVRRHDISVDGREPRGALDVEVEVGPRPLRVIVTHLGLRARERRQQARRLAGLLEGYSGDVVLLGDFNQWLPGGTLGPLVDRLQAHPLRRTFPARWPLLPLDRIWVSPRERLLRLATHRSPLARTASDHLPIWAELGDGVPRTKETAT